MQYIYIAPLTAVNTAETVMAAIIVACHQGIDLFTIVSGVIPFIAAL